MTTMIVLLVGLATVPTSDVQDAADRAVRSAKAEVLARHAIDAAKATVIAQHAISAAKDEIMARRTVEYSQAYRIAIRLRRPMLVVVGMECQGVCAELRPDIIVTHAEIIDDDRTPRVILAVPQNGTMYRVHQWRRMPSADEVRAVVREAMRQVGHRDEGEWSPLGLALAIGQMWQDCPGGVCPAPSTPGTGVDTTRSAPASAVIAYDRSVMAWHSAPRRQPLRRLLQLVRLIVLRRW